MAGPTGKTGNTHATQPTVGLEIRLQPLLGGGGVPTTGQIWPRK